MCEQQPEPPREEPGQAQRAAVAPRPSAARWWRAHPSPGNGTARVARPAMRARMLSAAQVAHLLGGRRDARHRLAVLLQAGEVAGDEDFRMSGQRQIVRDAHASRRDRARRPPHHGQVVCRAVRRRRRPPTGWCARRCAVPKRDEVVADLGDRRAGVHFDAEALELRARLVREASR